MAALILGLILGDPRGSRILDPHPPTEPSPSYGASARPHPRRTAALIRLHGALEGPVQAARCRTGPRQVQVPYPARAAPLTCPWRAAPPLPWPGSADSCARPHPAPLSPPYLARVPRHVPSHPRHDRIARRTGESACRAARGAARHVPAQRASRACTITRALRRPTSPAQRTPWLQPTRSSCVIARLSELTRVGSRERPRDRRPPHRIGLSRRRLPLRPLSDLTEPAAALSTPDPLQGKRQ